MFGMGMPEVLLILAIALIVIGPKKLPDLAKSLGRAMIEFKRATTELKASLEVDTDVTDIKKSFKEVDRSLKTAMDRAPSTAKSGATESKAAPPPSDAAPADPGPPANADAPETEAADAAGASRESRAKEGAARDDA